MVIYHFEIVASFVLMNSLHFAILCIFSWLENSGIMGSAQEVPQTIYAISPCKTNSINTFLYFQKSRNCNAKIVSVVCWVSYNMDSVLCLWNTSGDFYVLAKVFLSADSASCIRLNKYWIKLQVMRPCKCFHRGFCWALRSTCL